MALPLHLVEWLFGTHGAFHLLVVSSMGGGLWGNSAKLSFFSLTVKFFVGEEPPIISFPSIGLFPASQLGASEGEMAGGQASRTNCLL
jgi:hypothetical protein